MHWGHLDDFYEKLTLYDELYISQCFRTKLNWIVSGTDFSWSRSIGSVQMVRTNWASKPSLIGSLILYKIIFAKYMKTA